jgi:hypothetical protein
MNERREQMSLPSVEAWRGEFMTAASAYAETERRTPWWRRWFTPFLIVFALAFGGVATATFIEFLTTDPKPVPYKGESHGYINLKTGEPIRCPDGSLLVETPETDPDKVRPSELKYGDGISYAGKPRCPDGSVPEIYRKQWERYVLYLENELPRFPIRRNTDEKDFPLDFAFELPEDGELEAPIEPEDLQPP